MWQQGLTLRNGLLTKVLVARLGQWREQAVSSPFLTTPRLMEFDWQGCTFSFCLRQPNLFTK